MDCMIGGSEISHIFFFSFGKQVKTAVKTFLFSGQESGHGLPSSAAAHSKKLCFNFSASLDWSLPSLSGPITWLSVCSQPDVCECRIRPRLYFPQEEIYFRAPAKAHLTKQEQKTHYIQLGLHFGSCCCSRTCTTSSSWPAIGQWPSWLSPIAPVGSLTLLLCALTGREEICYVCWQAKPSANHLASFCQIWASSFKIFFRALSHIDPTFWI